jgi:hypothetical protein
MASPKVWESVHHKLPTQAEDSLVYAHSQQPHTSLQNKDNSSAPTPPNGIKSQLWLHELRPHDISGAPTQAIDANLARSTLTHTLPHTMANSSMTNGTNTPTTVNFAGTLPLDG